MRSNPWWHYQFARLCTMFRRYQRAEEALQAALSLDPGYTRAQALLGFVYGASGRRDLAAAQFGRALELKPDDPILLFNLGYVRHLQKAYGPAIEAFERALRINPKIDRAWYGMGLALASLGRHEESARAFKQAAELQPMNGYAWFELGMAYHALGRREQLDEVIAHLNRFDPKMTQHLVRATRQDEGAVEGSG
jgi:tetratricopeptide (TPR) repeat protein